MAVVQGTSIRLVTFERNNLLAFSPDGKTLVFALDQDEVHICYVHDLNIRRRLAGQEHAASIVSVAFDPSSKFLASAGNYQDVRLWIL
jgi:WD40 repeat protein